MVILARRLIKNRAIQKQLDRRQKIWLNFGQKFKNYFEDLKMLRRQQAAAIRSPIVMHSAGTGLPRTQPIPTPGNLHSASPRSHLRHPIQRTRAARKDGGQLLRNTED
ncbi:hypothetical protein niasHT_036433 [Heterodera trifolii]|uniref:Uncharacterized protein n=1 Tax=Heterodera trifolii TaxID=157864 RepID=A0ABD2HXA2_9BILA